MAGFILHTFICILQALYITSADFVYEAQYLLEVSLSIDDELDCIWNLPTSNVA
jgi:hypothetical protein